MSRAACQIPSPVTSHGIPSRGDHRDVVLIRRLYGIVFLLFLGGILVACLLPFRSPENEVAWLTRGNGIRFGEHGTVISRGAIYPGCRPEEAGCTLEVWLQPSLVWNSSTILAFYEPQRAGGFSVHQHEGRFILETRSWKRDRLTPAQTLYLGDAFRTRGLIFLTLTLSSQGVKAYINGVLSQAAQAFRVPADGLRGRLVVANSPVLNDSWTGKLKGIALYGRELSSAQVLRDYEAWRRAGRPSIKEGGRAIALYLFDEGSGAMIHDRSGSRNDLYIPKKYMELHHTRLRRPWEEYSPTWHFWKDSLINIAGFIPLGFFCYAWLSLLPGIRRPALATVIFGCVVSLAVEILQSYLPTRDSGIMDIITNTLGTAVGIWLYRCINVLCAKFVDSRYAGLRGFGRLFAPITEQGD